MMTGANLMKQLAMLLVAATVFVIINPVADTTSTTTEFSNMTMLLEHGYRQPPSTNAEGTAITYPSSTLF